MDNLKLVQKCIARRQANLNVWNSMMKKLSAQVTKEDEQHARWKLNSVTTEAQSAEHDPTVSSLHVQALKNQPPARCNTILSALA